MSINGLRTFTKKIVLNFALRLLKTRVPSPCCHFYFFVIGVGSHDLYHCCVCDLGEQCHSHLCGLVLLHMKKSLSCSSCSLLSCSKSSCFVWAIVHCFVLGHFVMVMMVLLMFIMLCCVHDLHQCHVCDLHCHVLGEGESIIRGC